MPFSTYNDFFGFRLKTGAIIMAVYYIALGLVTGFLSCCGLYQANPEHREAPFDAFMSTLIIFSAFYIILSVIQLLNLYQERVIRGCVIAHLVLLVITIVVMCINLSFVYLNRPYLIAVFMGKYILFTIIFLRVLNSYDAELKTKETGAYSLKPTV